MLINKLGSTLILLRHGQSIWNLSNIFTGWVDVPLTITGRKQAVKVGNMLLNNNIIPNVCFESELIRSQDTLHIVKNTMNIEDIPTFRSWKMNERHYGKLQGLNKLTAESIYTKDKVTQWRRSYNSIPPLLSFKDYYNPKFESKYNNINHDQLPLGESLKMTRERILPYWNNKVSKYLCDNNTILISGHGNSLRSLIMEIDNISEQDITKLHIPNCVPIIYKFDYHKNIITDNQHSTLLSAKYLL